MVLLPSSAAIEKVQCSTHTQEDQSDRLSILLKHFLCAAQCPQKGSEGKEPSKLEKQHESVKYLNYEYGVLHSRCRGIPKQSPTQIPRILLVGCCTYWQSLQSSKTCSRVDLQAGDPFHVKPVANDLKSLLALDTETV